MSRNHNYLFNEEYLSDFLRSRQEAMRAEIDGLASDYVLKVSLDDLADHLAEKYSVEPVVFSDDVVIGDHGETKIDVRDDPRRAVFDPSKPCYVNATFATFVIPFIGDARVFRFRPSEWSTLVPTGDVVQGEVRVRLQREDHDANAMRADFERIFKSIQQHIDWGAGEIRVFNQGLRQQAKERLEWRTKKFLADQGMVAGLGFPIRRRGGAADTYTAPVTRKKLPITKPAVAAGAFKPELTLEMEHYEHILGVISNMR